jgi:putative oxidoreductase
MLVAWGELVGGIALAFGFLTRLAAFGIALIMAGAIWTVHGKNGFAMANPEGFVKVDGDRTLFDLGKSGYEYNFVLLVICAAVILLGGGTLAVDRIFRLRARHPVVGK